MEDTVKFSVTGLNSKQFALVMEALKGGAVEKKESSEHTLYKELKKKDLAPLKKRAKKTEPEPTVSEEEDESFGIRTLSEEDLVEEEIETDDEEHSALTFDTVKDALNEYGHKHPDEARAILLGVGVKSSKELERTPKKWDAVYAKVMAKLPKKGKRK
jgi:hypothetical protein